MSRISQRQISTSAENQLFFLKIALYSTNHCNIGANMMTVLDRSWKSGTWEVGLAAALAMHLLSKVAVVEIIQTVEKV